MTASGDRLAGDGERRPGRPRGSDGASTRERVLRSAREVLSEIGYDRATPAAIAKRAGMTRTAFYHYFAGKPELYAALFDSIHEGVLARVVQEAAQADGPLTARLRVLLETAARVNAEDTSFARFIVTTMVEASRHPEFAGQAEAQIEAIRSFFRAEVRVAAASGGLRPDVDPKAVTDMLVAVLWGVGLFAAFIGSPEELEGAIGALEMLLAGELFTAPPTG